MQQSELETKAAGRHAWFARQDAITRSRANQSRFSHSVQLKAQRVSLVLDLLYANSEISITYNKTSVRVKAHAARARCRKQIAQWEQDWALDGISKKVTPQGVIYLIPA